MSVVHGREEEDRGGTQERFRDEGDYRAKRQMGMDVQIQGGGSRQAAGVRIMEGRGAGDHRGG
jgi:hypothetical protein